jgi:hypothetical protein
MYEIDDATKYVEQINSGTSGQAVNPDEAA